MKKLFFSLFFFLLLASNSAAQTVNTFDLATFKTPAGWKTQKTESSVQLSTEDRVSGGYCLITLFKALAGTASSKENFDAAWDGVVKGTLKPTAAPQMQPPVSDDGWEVVTGFAPFDNDGAKGLGLLVTITGFGKMVNVMIATNTGGYQKEVDAFLQSIELKKPAVEAPVRTSITRTAAPAASNWSGFTYTTTNFDDGWTGTVQEDWVQVSKGGTVVLIHYPNKIADAYTSSVMDGLKKAWDVLVAPRYSSGKNFEFKPLTGWQSIEFAEADLVPNGSAKAVHVVLFKMGYSNGTGRYMEFITPTKSDFEREFGPYRDSTAGWERLESMLNYNKFAVAAADLTGKWTNDFSGSLSYVNAYTGFDAGTNSHASKENFSFAPGGTYNWDLGMASGMVGNIKFQGVKSSGRVSVPKLWQVTFSSIEGKPRTYNAHFTCIKGARILWLDGRPFGKIQ